MIIKLLITLSWVTSTMRKSYIRKRVSVDLRHLCLLCKSNAATCATILAKWRLALNFKNCWSMIRSNYLKFQMASHYSKFTTLISQKFWRWNGLSRECKSTKMKHFLLQECTKTIFWRSFLFLYSHIGSYMVPHILIIIMNIQISKQKTSFSKLTTFWL